MGNTLGKNIKTFRKNKGLTQEELAELLNITPQAVSKWESENGLSDVSMLIPLAQVLGVTTDTLLGYDSLSENEALISRVRETVAGLERSVEGRDQKALKVCEYLSTETTLNPGCFELIKDYAEETANLSMYAGFAKQIDGEDLTGEEKKQALELLNNDISHYSKYC